MWWGVVPLAAALLACSSGDGGQSDASAGPDATGTGDAGGAPRICNVDFPCRDAYQCTDKTHWVALQTQDCHVQCGPGPCNGASCGTTGEAQACPAPLQCAAPDQGDFADASVRCTYGGIPHCVPADESGYVPPATPAAPAKQPGVCADADIEQAWSCMGVNTPSCTSWNGAHAACVSCLGYGAFTAPKVGGMIGLLNRRGCYAVLEGTIAPGSCAALESASQECSADACASCVSSPEDFLACVAAARTTSCASFPTCDADAGAFATCEIADEHDFYVTFGKALCGP